VVGAVGAGMITLGGEGLLPPIVLLKFYFYTDSIGDKSVQMLNSEPTSGGQNQDQQKLSDSNGPTHLEKYPYIDEFSEFIATVSTKALKYQLMTYPQRLMAKALWEAQNFGGSKEKCIEHLTKVYGPAWRKFTTFEEHMEEERVYCEYVLILDHMKQWDKHQKLATLCKKQPTQ
jgi:hypothetical protein